MKKSNFSIVLVVFALFFSGCSHIRYICQAGLGQWAIYNHERPIEEVIADPRTSNEVREKLQWIPEIKKYVEQTLKVKPTSNYTTYTDLKRPYVVWSLTSAEKYELKIKSWSFPFVGSFPYLGFFNKEMVEEWQQNEIAKGMDTSVRGVTAYSTIGYFRDPILSSMLSKKKADLVNLIFHESTHSQVYIKGEGAFNEQIASYIGDYGERQWIETNFGSKSEELKEWNDDRFDRKLFAHKMIDYSEQLKKEYEIIKTLSIDEKKTHKDKLFETFRNDLQDEKKSPFKTKSWKQFIVTRFVKGFDNNAILLAHLTYEENQEVFEVLFQKCEGSLAGSLRVFKRFAEYHSAQPNASMANEKNLTLQFADWLRSQAGGGICLDVNLH